MNKRALIRIYLARYFLFLLITLLSIGYALLSIERSIADEGEFVFLLKGRGNVFWKVIRDGIEETAKEQKISAVILNTDDDQTPEAQLNMCLTSIARKPKVIVLGAATKNIGLECFRKAAAAGIRFADIDGNVTVNDAKEAHLSMDFTVASDNTLIGRSAAEYLAKTSTKKDPKILILKGLPGSIVSEQRTQGFIDGIKSLLPEAHIVGSPPTYWDRMKAMNTTLDFLQREPELDVIFSVSDVMTLGVVEAVKVAAKDRKIDILSVDGNADARKAILDGRIKADVAQLPYLMGKRAVELALSASKGELNGATEYTPIPVLTKESLEQNTDPNLRFLR